MNNINDAFDHWWDINKTSPFLWSIALFQFHSWLCISSKKLNIQNKVTNSLTNFYPKSFLYKIYWKNFVANCNTYLNKEQHPYSYCDSYSKTNGKHWTNKSNKIQVDYWLIGVVIVVLLWSWKVHKVANHLKCSRIISCTIVD